MNKKTIVITLLLITPIVTIYLGIDSLIRKRAIPPILEGTKTIKEKILRNAESIDSSSDILLVAKSEEQGLYGNPKFEIQYQPQFDLFLITLLDKPLEEIREKAEQALLEKSGGEINKLCQLPVLISSPHYVREDEIIENPRILNICQNR